MKRAGISRASKAGPKTPELNKMHAVKEKSQAIGEFLDVFLREKGVQLGSPHIHNEKCVGWDEHRNRYNPSIRNRCELHEGEFMPFHYSIENLLAEFFEIDLKVVERERRAILKFIQEQDGKSI